MKEFIDRIQVMRVFVYWNSNLRTFSIRSVKTGKVIRHADHVTLADARFKVSLAGRRRVLVEGQKNVHAGVEGVLAEGDPFWGIDGVKVSYDPYEKKGFTTTFSEYHRGVTIPMGTPVVASSWAKLDVRNECPHVYAVGGVWSSEFAYSLPNGGKAQISIGADGFVQVDELPDIEKGLDGSSWWLHLEPGVKKAQVKKHLDLLLKG